MCIWKRTWRWWTHGKNLKRRTCLIRARIKCWTLYIYIYIYFQCPALKWLIPHPPWRHPFHCLQEKKPVPIPLVRRRRRFCIPIPATVKGHLDTLLPFSYISLIFSHSIVSYLIFSPKSISIRRLSSLLRERYSFFSFSANPFELTANIAWVLIYFFDFWRAADLYVIAALAAVAVHW